MTTTRILLAFVWSPYTTAAYFAKAFRAMGHDVRTLGPCDDARWATWPEEKRYRLTGPHFRGEWGDWRPDVSIWVEGGALWYPDLRPMGAPTIGYFIDSHSRLEVQRQAAPMFDRVFVAHRQYVEQFPGAQWLPVACDPEVHTPTVTGEPEYDVAFVGNTYSASPIYARRRAVLEELGKRYRCNFRGGVYFEDMANVYASAGVAFNISTGGDLNMRVFEAMCSGRPLVTDWADGMAVADIFNPYQHLMLYDDDGGLLYSAIDMFLHNPGIADKQGQVARAEVLAHHTYAHRAAQMLAAL